MSKHRDPGFRWSWVLSVPAPPTLQGDTQPEGSSLRERELHCGSSLRGSSSIILTLFHLQEAHSIATLIKELEAQDEADRQRESWVKSVSSLTTTATGVFGFPRAPVCEVSQEFQESQVALLTLVVLHHSWSLSCQSVNDIY